VKPSLGYTNRFGWRMFTEVLRMRIAVTTRVADAWRPYVPDGRWSTDELRYHWDSLGEQRVQLRAYAEWILAQQPDAGAVRVVITYERDGVAGDETIEAAR
jgi:hypothetical protein